MGHRSHKVRLLASAVRGTRGVLLGIGFFGAFACDRKTPAPAVAPVAALPAAIELTTVRAAPPNNVVGLVPFARDVLITLPPGPAGRYGGRDSTGWDALGASKLGPLLKSSEGGSRIAAAVAVRDDLVLYARADREHDAGVFVYRGRADQLLPVAGAAELRSQLASGATLDLAEPRMLVAGDTVWIILRIDDQTQLLRLDARLVAGGAPRVSRPFETLTEKDRPFGIERDDVWFADVDGSLALLRPASGACWRVGPGGQLQRQPARTPRPAPTAGPLILPAKRPGEKPSVLEFFAVAPLGSEGFGGEGLGPMGQPLQYPAFILHDGGRDVQIGLDAITVRLGFPKRALRLTTWVAAGEDVFAYDAMSGEVFRVTLRNVE